MGTRKSKIIRTGTEWTNARHDSFATYLRMFAGPGLHPSKRKAFIDVFAGTSYHLPPPDGTELLFPQLGTEEPRALLAGFARMALETSPAFDAYIFVGPSRKLGKAELEFGGARTKQRSRAATIELAELCELSWVDRCAAMFLDPFGMQIEWSAIESIARTRAIDLHVLYPVGFGAKRLGEAPHELPEPWRRHLDGFLGTRDWYDELLAASAEPTLFGDDRATAAARLGALGRRFQRRLGEVFPAATGAAELVGASGEPLYLYCFGAGDEGEAARTSRFAEILGERLSGRRDNVA